MEIYKIHVLCDGEVHPIGVTAPNVRLSWDGPKDAQNKLRIRVYSFGESAEQELFFESKFAQNYDVGFTLSTAGMKSMTQYFWKIEFGDSVKINYTMEEPASFETGLLDNNLWKGTYIGFPSPVNAAGLFRYRFAATKKVKKVRVYLVTEGFSELWLNGSRLGDSVLDPANTDYGKRLTVLTYDVGGYIQEGENAVGVRLSNGWATHGKFRLQMYITYNDGTVEEHHSAYGTWICALSPILRATIYGGELYASAYEKPEWNIPSDSFERKYHYNYWHLLCCGLHPTRKITYDSSAGHEDAYYDVLELPPPKGVITSSGIEPIRKVGVLMPVSASGAVDGTTVYDFGQNISGWVKIRMKGSSGSQVVLQYTELLMEDGSVSMDYLWTADPHYPFPMQTDIVYLKGQGIEEYEPSFTYHGFRYVAVSIMDGEGTVESIEAQIVHSDVKQIGSFSCSNQLINNIQSCILWSEVTNLMSIPTDCPQRAERQGWLNDMVVRGEGALYNVNLYRFYKKWLWDIADTQDSETGAIADTAPFRRGNFPGDPILSVYLLLPKLLFDFYGDADVIAEHYEGMKKWALYLYRNSKEGVITRGAYGDWAPPADACFRFTPVSRVTSTYFVASCYGYYNFCLMAQFAALCDRKQDVESFTALRARIRASINREFYDAAAGAYDKGSQGSNVLALYFGLAEPAEVPKVLQNLLLALEEHDYKLTTGNLATKYILEVLSDYGYTDIAYRIVTAVDYPSWGYMLSKNATTIWERWEYETGQGMNSHNHPMYGSITAWFYKYLAGIAPARSGFRDVNIKPCIPRELESVDVRMELPSGELLVHWKQENERLQFGLVIPTGTVAHVTIPTDFDREIPIVNGQKHKGDQASGHRVLTLTAGGYELVMSRSYKQA